MRNRFPGTCYECHKHVAKGDGHFERIRGPRYGLPRWRVKCAACAIANHVRREQAISKEAPRG